MIRITINASSEGELNRRLDELIERNRAVVIKKGQIIGYRKSFDRHEHTGRHAFTKCEDTIKYVAVVDLPDNRKAVHR